MRTYKNLNGNSGVVAFSISETFIDVKFESGGVYRYSEGSVGSKNLAIMKALAISGAGLNAFINRNVRFQYSNRFGFQNPTPAAPAAESVNIALNSNNAVEVVAALVKSGKPINISVSA